MPVLSFTALVEAVIKNIFVVVIRKCVFWKSNFRTHFLREPILIIVLGNWLQLLLINNYWLIRPLFFIKLFTTSILFLILTCLNINLKLLITGSNQSRYVSRGTCLECLLPLGKSSASWGKDWVESIWWSLTKHGVLQATQVNQRGGGGVEG